MSIERRYKVLAVLTLIYLVNFIDRQVLSILLQPIQREFGVSDSVLGLLVGPTFAFFYATMGVPLAMVADRMDRRRLITGSLFLFSLTTALCGLVGHFWQLVLVRIGTGIGEAGTGPASQTIITDIFPPAERVRAQAIYATGANLGVLVAFAAGGIVAERFGWRMAFLLAGLPGIVLAVVAWRLLRGLGQRAAIPAGRAVAAAGASLSAFRQSAGLLWRLRSFRLILLGACMTCFSGNALVAFFPAFLERTHGMGMAGIGLTVALIVGAGGGTATYLAGVVTDRLRPRDDRWSLWVPALTALLGLPLAPICFLADDRALVLTAAILPLSVTAAFIGPVINTVQELAPGGIRATAVAVLILVDNLIGLGLGPQFVGIASDLLRPALGADSLRWGLLLSCGGYAVSALGFLLAARHLRADLAQIRAQVAGAVRTDLLRDHTDLSNGR